MDLFNKNKVEELQKEVISLETQLKNLKSQLPRIMEISKLIEDLDHLGAGMLNVLRVPIDEIYRWRND